LASGSDNISLIIPFAAVNLYWDGTLGIGGLGEATLR
jgi:hypothetical protein